MGKPGKPGKAMVTWPTNLLSENIGLGTNYEHQCPNTQLIDLSIPKMPLGIPYGGFYSVVVHRESIVRPPGTWRKFGSNTPWAVTSHMATEIRFSQ